MQNVNAAGGMGPQLYALKQANEIQGANVMKLLESAQPPQQQSVNSSDLTGLGKLLDIKA